ncbi:SH2 domain containing 1A duplicate a [Hoplias malabaricus]|uniref:SH2 domain containing 1A duplicate a n=1 Tax=Hoplias malabaricus TaxID=27720 RepID=UPI00346219C1
MEELEMYHGSISKSQTEELLYQAGRDGSYLVRDSESVPETYCICVLLHKKIITYRLFQVEGNLWKAETARGVKERVFRNVRNLINAFQLPDQGIAIPLLYPVTINQQQNYHHHISQHQPNRKTPPTPQRRINC